MASFVACGSESPEPRTLEAGPQSRAAAAPPEAVPAAPERTGRRSAAARPDTAFAGLIERLSEPGGFFDTDNLISNETSYLHVMGALEELGARGGAYIGVGPDQNFSYIAMVRPEIAYIIDIRRDNLLQHLWFKALFQLAPTRVEFLSAMFGRPPPDDPEDWSDATALELADRIDAEAYDRDYEVRLWNRVSDAVGELGVPLTDDDLVTIGTIQHRFDLAGLDLRFTSHFRGPRPSYPTYRDLMTETDLLGRDMSYLASEDRYRFVREMQVADRVVPVVGDLAGSHALRAIGDDVRARGLAVSAFYTSNVEFYLMQEGSFAAFAANVGTLPVDEHAFIIRSYFNRFDTTLPQARPGYASTQLLQPMTGFLQVSRGEGFRGYWDLITRHDVPPR